MITRLSGLTIISIILVIIVLVILSYNQQRTLYYSQLKSDLVLIQKPLEQQASTLEQTLMRLKTDSNADLNQIWYREVQQKLDMFSGTGLIANTYLLSPEASDKDGKSSLTLLMANQALYKTGQKPYTSYEMSETFKQAVDKAKKSGFGRTSVYTDKAGKWISVIAPVKNESGKMIALVGLDFDYNTIFSDLKGRLGSALVIGLVVALFATVLLTLLIYWLLRPIGQLTRITQKVASGDLTETPNIKRKDEIGQLSSYFGLMIENIREMIQHIHHSSEEMARTSQAVEMGSRQTSEASQAITRSITDVAAGSERQLRSTEESGRGMEEMTVGIQRIAESASAAVESSSSALQLAERGGEQVERNLQQMGLIREAVNDASGTILHLGELSKEIGNITGMISEIAQQTNLLALNAAIEAARAGEHGRGFSVVADSIRGLAEQSRNSTEKIYELIQVIQAETEQAVKAMKKGATEVDGMSETVTAVNSAFTSIVKSVEEVTRQIMEVSASSEQMSAGSEEVTASLHELSSISKQTSDFTQNVASSVEEQQASMEEMAFSVASLNEMAQQLRETVSRFKL